MKRIASLLVVAAIALTMLSTSFAATTNTSKVYPINTDVKLKVWGSLDANAATIASNFGDLPVAKELEKRTGVKIEYIHPSSANTNEMEAIMIASGNLPDIMRRPSKGIDYAVNNKVIITLEKIMPKSAPNAWKLLNSSSNIKHMSSDVDGKVSIFPVVTAKLGRVWAGPIVRKDWLDDLKLKEPVTIADWENMLKLFKEKKGAKIPLTFEFYAGAQGMPELRGAFAGAFGVLNPTWPTIQVDNGKINSSIAGNGYKEFLKLMKKWYDLGYISKDYPLTTGAIRTSNMLTGVSGATVGNVGGGIKTLMDSMKGKDSKFNVVGVNYPVLKKGQRSYGSQLDMPVNQQFAYTITTACKNPDIAAKWLDYTFTTEGAMLGNFGIEGLTYKTVKGWPYATDFVNNNPNKQTTQQVNAQYRLVNWPLPVDSRAVINGWVYPQQREAVTKWQKTNAEKHVIPPVSFTDDEQKQITAVQNDMLTYATEMQTKFIMGAESIDSKYAEYESKMKQIGLDTYLKNYQSAYNRFIKLK